MAGHSHKFLSQWDLHSVQSGMQLAFRASWGFPMTLRTLGLAALVLAAPLVASAQDGFEQGRLRVVEGGVVVQRSSETSAEDATPNTPFLPGDRVWTDGGGRAEFQFTGALVRLDNRSKLDYVTFDEGRDPRVVLRLWSGSLYVHTRDFRGAPDLEVETPAGVVALRKRGVSRIDVRSAETRLSVFEGEAILDAGRETRVREGERVWVAQGEELDGPEGFDRAETDDFARWDGDLEQQAWANARSGYVPDEIAAYAGELDAHGAWYYEAEIGHVWRPYVAVGWSPYTHGRWCWTAYGWTWVPSEPWGWAPFHYGRWGHSAALGWYWIPGRTWGPAWVSWAVGGDYVGWAPLGYRDRPVLVQHATRRGYASPRGSSTTVSSTPWVYARRGDLATRDLARRRLEAPPSDVHDVRVLEPGRAQLTRELRVAEGAVPRNVSTKPSIGDTVPELRHDPTTTIPFPAVRRAREREERNEPEGGTGTDDRGFNRPRPGRSTGTASRPTNTAAPADVRGPAPGSTGAPVSAIREGDTGRRVNQGDGATEAPRARPRDRWEHPATSGEGSRGGDVRGPAEGGARRHEDTSRDADREVLRPLFRPLTQPRGEAQGDGERSGDGARRRHVDSDSDRPRSRPDSDGDRPRSRPEPASRDGSPRGESSGRERRAEPREHHQPPPPPPPAEHAKPKKKDN
jgi:FecR protein